jgi:hypothetical protein
MFGQLLIDLCDHLKEAVPKLKWIDQDFGQLELFEDRPAVSFPCALIDFQNATYSNHAELTQEGDLTVLVRLGFTPFSNSHVGASLAVRKKALEYYEIEQKVFIALQGWSPLAPGEVAGGETYTHPFIRVSATTEQRLSANNVQDASGIRVRILAFNTTIEDNSALKKYAAKTVQLGLETEIQL